MDTFGTGSRRASPITTMDSLQKKAVLKCGLTSLHDGKEIMWWDKTLSSTQLILLEEAMIFKTASNHGSLCSITFLVSVSQVPFCPCMKICCKLLAAAYEIK